MTDEIDSDAETNEVEILEFLLGGQSFGVNVAKIMQILAYDETKFTAVPDEGKANLGVLLWQKQTIPLIDLNVAINRKKEDRSERPIVLVLKFYEQTNGFLINNVNRIHRVGWDQVKPTESIFSKYSSNIIGTISIDDNEILLIDFEYIITKLFPDMEMVCNIEDIDINKELIREDLKIIFSEDSTIIRNNVSS
jgi:two-component system chemotaxis response regulator CheV